MFFNGDQDMMKPILTSALMLMTLSAGAFTVTEAGKPAAEIVVDVNAAAPIVKAAEELQHWIKEISGAELKIAAAPSKDVSATLTKGIPS